MHYNLSLNVSEEVYRCQQIPPLVVYKGDWAGGDGLEVSARNMVKMR